MNAHNTVVPRRLREADRNFGELVSFLMTCSNEKYVAGTMVIEALPAAPQSYSILDLIRDIRTVIDTPEHAARMIAEAEFLRRRTARLEGAA